MVLCVTALLFGAIQGEGSDSLQPKSLLELLKKDARDLAELVKYHDTKLDAEEQNGEQPEGVVENKRELGVSRPLGKCEKTLDRGLYGALCPDCWYWRELPAGYSPRYLNERKCMGQECLKGHGTCVQQYTNAGVTKDGQEISVQLASGCKCGMRPDSVLFDQYYP
uniref:CTCK domain-containing protein n=1 Tax=Branchiostoma floridae TaxID=7739 RepID=C3XUV9_BRAFL|eukprot:XP_002612175.1 hypothetical protein BRAFLDRAFT_88917 [Branchiostoma floridae]